MGSGCRAAQFFCFLFNSLSKMFRALDEVLPEGGTPEANFLRPQLAAETAGPPSSGHKRERTTFRSILSRGARAGHVFYYAHAPTRLRLAQ